MKKIFTQNMLYVAVFLIAIMVLLSCAETRAEKYTYKIVIQIHSGTTEDYTNSVEYLPNGGVRYTDEYGRNITRFGSYSIEKLK